MKIIHFIIVTSISNNYQQNNYTFAITHNAISSYHKK